MKLPKDYNKLTTKGRRIVRTEYVNRQAGLCWFCRAPLTCSPPKDIACKPINKSLFPEHFFKYPVHLHHNRKTGMTIGAVHNHCNAVLWQYYRE